MISLLDMKCVPTRKGEPSLTVVKINELKPQVPDWQVEKQDGIDILTRSYKFKNFSQALDFTNQVGQLAEDEDHHPMLVTEWGKVTITLWTHSIGGLHLNDFIMAAKSDIQYQNMG